MSDPRFPRDDLRELSNRIRQTVELQEILREGKASARPSSPRPSRTTRAASGERPRPAARVAQPAPVPEPAPAAIVRNPWQRDPASTNSLGELHETYGECQRCELGRGRTNFVFGVGNPKSTVMFVGEAPGRDEDLQGEPFVGRAGQLLNKILEAIDFRREDVYIANILKCRPPGNRDPQPVEIAACEPILRRQIELIRPVILCTLGSFAARTLLGTSQGITRLRGRLHEYRGVPLVPTYHPAALLRNPSWKRPTWEDVQMLRREHDRLVAESPAGAAG